MYLFVTSTGHDFRFDEITILKEYSDWNRINGMAPGTIFFFIFFKNQVSSNTRYTMPVII